MQNYRLYRVLTLEVRNVPKSVVGNVPNYRLGNARHSIYFLFQKVDVAGNTIPAAGSESVLLVTAGLQICLQFDRVGVRGVEVCLQTRACRVGGSYHSTHSPLLYNLIGAKPQLEGP